MFFTLIDRCISVQYKVYVCFALGVIMFSFGCNFFVELGVFCGTIWVYFVYEVGCMLFIKLGVFRLLCWVCLVLGWVYIVHSVGCILCNHYLEHTKDIKYTQMNAQDTTN